MYLTPTKKRSLKIPTPPPFKNHGNEVISVSALARYQQRVAEEAGAYILTETSATQLVVEDGEVKGVRTGDKGRGKDGEPKGNFEPGTDIKAKATVLAEGCWGHLTGPAIREFDLGRDREPQTWELGVKEVWKVPKALDRVIHTIGPWPVSPSAKYGQVGGTWIYPMKDEKTGDDLVSIGFVIDLEYADATTSAHDLLQTFKTHPLVRKILEGGERVGWGAKALPGGGYWSMPKLSMPGAVLAGDAGGMVDTVALKGVHHSINSGILAAEAIYKGLKNGSTDFSSYEESIEDSVTGKELWEVRNTRQPFSKGFFIGGPLVNLFIATKGKIPVRLPVASPGREADVHRQDVEEVPDARRQVHLRQALERVHLGQRHPRRRPEPHPRAEERAARGGRDVEVDVPRRGLRDPRRRARGGRRGRGRELHELRSVRSDHRQGRAPDHARGRRRAAVPEHVAAGTATQSLVPLFSTVYPAAVSRCRAAFLSRRDRCFSS